MTNTNTLRKAAILITALDTRSADQLLDQMPAAQAARIREAVFELEDIDPREQQRILSEFLRSTGRAVTSPGVDFPQQTAIRSEDSNVELYLSSSGNSAAVSDRRSPAQPRVPVGRETYESLYQPPASHSPQRPFDFLGDQEGVQLARMLEREHPQTIAVVAAHLPPDQAAALVGELMSALQAEVLRRIADLAVADPQSLEEIEQELRRSFQAVGEVSARSSAGMTTVSSILEAAGSTRAAMLRNIRQYDRHLSRRLGEEPIVTDSIATPLGSLEWDDEPPTESSSRIDAHNLTNDIEAYRRLARSAQQAGSWQAGEDDSSATPQTQLQPARSNTTTVQWHFADLDSLSDRDLARVLQAAESDLTMVALAGAEPDFVARLTNQLPPALARQFCHRIETVGPLALRDIEAAQRQIAAIAADLAGQGKIQQKQSKPFAMAA